MKQSERIDKNEKRITKNENNIVKVMEQLKYLIEEIDKIENNHLAHIQAEISKLREEIFLIRNKMAYWAGGLAVIIIILDLVIKFVR